jgi:perosamine synthetase
MRIFRHHGMTRPQGAHPWNYEVASLGQNYRITDFQCALAGSQLTKLLPWHARRQAIAKRYDEELASMRELRPLEVRPGVDHAYHLYVVRLELERLRTDRDRFLAALRAEGILATLHYPPIHLHPYYRKRFGLGPGLCPAGEAAAEAILSLPVFPGMSDADQGDVLEALRKVLDAYRR